MRARSPPMSRAGAQNDTHLLWLLIGVSADFVLRSGDGRTPRNRDGPRPRRHDYLRFRKWWKRFSLADPLLLNFVAEFAAVVWALARLGLSATLCMPVVAVGLSPSVMRNKPQQNGVYRVASPRKLNEKEKQL